MRGRLRAGGIVYRSCVAANDRIVDTVLDERRLVGRTEDPLVIRLVLGKEERDVLVAGEPEFA